jgi:hypothetical protein
MKSRSLQVWIILLVFAVVGVNQYCSPPEQRDQQKSEYLNHGDSAHYVGKSTCGQCHTDKLQTFVQTGMGQSFDTASLTKSSANLTQHLSLYDSFLNLHYYPFWRGNRLFVLEYRLEDSDTVYKREEEITYIIGSGQHTNSHLIQKGDYVVQAPFTWYAQDGKLDFPPGFEDGANSRFSRVIDEECMSCHNGLPTMKPGSMRAFASIPHGIDCERCHGPGSIHVKRRQMGLEPEGETDFSIVNPAKLSLDRQIDLCQRCHLQGNNVLKPGKNFHDFKPGMVLSDVFEIFLPQYDNSEQLFNMANHSDRFQHSKCYITTKQEGKKVFSCITCHNPHVSVKQTKQAYFRQACLNCHKVETCSEEIAVRTTQNDNCITCHMPVSGTEDIPHVRVHDHKIAVQRKPDEVKEGSVVGLYSVNNPNPGARTQIEAYLTYYEKFDPLPVYQKKAAELLKQHDFPHLQIHLYYQWQQWKKIIDIVDRLPEDERSAVTCYRIGKAYTYTGQLEPAVQWLELAVLKDPTYFEYKNDLGSNLLKMNKLSEAEAVLSACLKQFPEYNPALNNLGFVYAQQGKYAQAKLQWQKSLQLDPDNIKAMENMALLASMLNKTQDEVYWLNQILKLQPDHKVAKNRLSQHN